MTKKQTLGEAVYKNLHAHKENVNVVDLQAELQKDWPEKIIKQAELDKKVCKEKNIRYSYLHIILKKAPHLPNTIDQRFISRYTAPAMTPSSTLYRFDHENENIELVWTLPPFDVMEEMHQNPNDFLDYSELLQFVNCYYGGHFEKIP